MSEVDIQTETPEPTTPDTAAEPTKDDLIAVAREAAEASRAEAGESTPAEEAKPAEPAAPAPEDIDTKIASVMRAREEAHKRRLEADDHLTKAKKEADETLSRAREEAKKLIDEQMESYRRRFRENPTSMARELAGGNIEEFVNAVMKDGSPEAIADAKRQAELADLRKDAEAGKSARQELDAFKKSQEEAQLKSQTEQVQQWFMKEHASVEKSPYMNARWEPEEVFAKCDALTRQWQQDGLKLGVDFDPGTVAAYLEKQSRDRLTKAPGLSQQSGLKTTGGNAPESAASGMRTVAAPANERRATPKAFVDMSEAEQREDLIRVTREEFRKYGRG